MDIAPNPLFVLLQAIPFVVTLLLLKSLIFDPMWDYIQGRRAATDGGREEIVALEAQVAGRMAELDKRLNDGRAQAAAIRARHRDAGTAKHDAMVAEVRAAAEGKLSAALVEIRRTEETTRRELEPMAQVLGREIAGQALGREVGA